MSDTYTCSILWPLVPLCRISGDVSSGFQSQLWCCLTQIVEAIPFDPPLVLHIADHLTDSTVSLAYQDIVVCHQ